MTYKDMLSSLDPKVWHSLSEEQKLDFFQSIENYMAMESNRISCKVNGKFLYTGEDGVVLGAYNPATGDIDINVSQFDEYSMYGETPDRLVQTCMHEGRHALQHQVVEGIVEFEDKELAKEWKENLEGDNYISYKRNPKAYYDQPVERDAREFAEKRYAELISEKEAMEKKQGENVNIVEARDTFAEQMENDISIAADYQGIDNKNGVSQRM